MSLGELSAGADGEPGVGHVLAGWAGGDTCGRHRAGHEHAGSAGGDTRRRQGASIWRRSGVELESGPEESVWATERGGPLNEHKGQAMGEGVGRAATVVRSQVVRGSC